MFVNPSDAEVTERLKRVRTIAVVGLSDKPSRDSYGVGEYLDDRGFSVVPINPTLEMWRGHQAFPDLAKAKKAAESVGKTIDLVDIFRRPAEVRDVLKQVVELKLPAAWCQLGVIDWDAAAWARQHGVWTVMDRCLAVEHRKLIGMRVGG